MLRRSAISLLLSAAATRQAAGAICINSDDSETACHAVGERLSPILDLSNVSEITIKFPTQIITLSVSQLLEALDS
jgi:hypothetical protein